MEAFTCKRCGAGLNIAPEDVVVVCQYCGYPNTIAGIVEPGDVYIVPSLSRARITSSFNSLVRGDYDLRRISSHIQIHEVRGFYIPVWTGEVAVRGTVHYFRRVVEDKRTETKYYTERVDKKIAVTLPARRQSLRFGVDEAIRHYLYSRPREEPLSEIDEYTWANIRLEILNTEFDKSEASKRLGEESLDIVRREYLSRASGIDAFLCSSGEPEGVRLLLLPVWWIYYRYKDSIYHCLFAGWDAEPLTRTEPIIAARRMAYIATAALLVLASPFVAWFLYKFSRDHGLEVLAVPLFMAAGSAYLSSVSLKSARVER